MAPRYAEIVMNRFPVLYFFHGLLVLFVMYQYHKRVLFEIEYTQKLNREVAQQTAVAEERSRTIVCPKCGRALTDRDVERHCCPCGAR